MCFDMHQAAYSPVADQTNNGLIVPQPKYKFKYFFTQNLRPKVFLHHKKDFETI